MAAAAGREGMVEGIYHSLPERSGRGIGLTLRGEESLFCRWRRRIVAAIVEASRSPS
jgi:hypothetical protein